MATCQLALFSIRSGAGALPNNPLRFLIALPIARADLGRSNSAALIAF